MDLIRLYYDSRDIRPYIILRHFLRYLGYYIEEVTERSNTGGQESVADIYIMSNLYMEGQSRRLDIEEDKTIFVLKDGWEADNSLISCVPYRLEITDEDFLFAFIEKLLEIIEKRESRCPSMIRSDPDWKKIVRNIAEAYLKSKLLWAELFTRCFYKQPTLYRNAIVKYKKFIEEIEKHKGNVQNADLLRYALLNAKYEANLISKKNFFEYHFSPDELLQECSSLLESYPGNEELYLLKADIMYELQDRWLGACDEYLVPSVAHCAYVYYKRGRIFRTKLKEPDIARKILEYGIELKGDYYCAWYQLASCYEDMGKFAEAIKAFRHICTILMKKYERHLLSPQELEYFYKAVMKIAVIYKTKLEDYTSAYAYGDLADEIREENAIDGYMEQMWNEDNDNDENKEKLKKIIYETIKEHVNLKLKEIC